MDLFGFFHVEGGFGLEKRSTTVRLADGSDQSVDLLALGASGVKAFAGLNGGSANELGLKLDGVEFGLALMNSTTDATRSWTSLQASVGTVDFVGIDGLEIGADNLTVKVNQAGKLGDAVVDYAAGATALEVITGPGNTLALDMAGSDGELLRAAGDLRLDVFGFFQVNGGFAIEKRDAQVTLADSTVQNVDLLAIGASRVQAFAGLNGGKPGELGLKLTDVEFGLALMSSKTDATRSWTSLQAGVGTAGFVGVEGLTIGGNTLKVEVNQAGRLGDQVVDYGAGATALELITGPLATDRLSFGMAGADGDLLRVSGNLEVDAFGFFQVEGGFAVEKRDTTVTLADGNTEAVSLLAIGASGVTAFAGVNGGTPEAMGLNLTGVEFGVALMSSKATPARSWTSVEAAAGKVSFDGSDGVEISADSLSVQLNQAGRLGDAVVDYAAGATSLEIATGPANTLKFAMAGSDGELLRASGNLTVDLFGFFHVEGGFAVEKRDTTVTLADGNTEAVSLLSIGASGVTAFAGINGGTPDELGLNLTGVEFGVALMSSKATPARSWTSVQAAAGKVSFDGIDGVEISADTLDVQLNQAGRLGDAVVDYAAGATDLEIATGPANTLKFSMAGADGELLRASGNLTVDLFGFFHVEGGFGLEKRSTTVRLADGSDQAVDLLALGASGVKAFAGLNGGSADELGLKLDGVEFALALMNSTTDATRSWTSLQASVGTVDFVGIDGLEIGADTLTVKINQAGRLGDAVVDYAAGATALEVITGPGNTLVLDMAGSDGELLRAAGNLRLDVFGFFQVNGGFAIEKRDTQVTLADTTVQDVSLLAIGASRVQAFAGLNGGTADELGLKLTDVEFGLALMSSKTDPTRSWTSLQAGVGRAAFVGIDGLTIAADTLTVEVNQGKLGDQVVTTVPARRRWS